MPSGQDDVGLGATLALAETAARPSTGEAGVAETLERGTHLGRYAIVDVRGRGGMGVVYEAYDPELDRKVALKVMRPDAEDLEKLRARFQREARAMARVSHPGIVPVHDVGRDGDRLFLSMELVDGENARAWVDRARPGWRAIVATYLGAGRGLVAAHAAGIVHRDVKPENVLVDRQGHGRIGDFGLAQTLASVQETPPGGGPGAPAPAAVDVTRAGEVIGTPAYMSPEQHRGDPVDARTDQFSFSISLWEALFGGRPFDEGPSPSYESVRDAVLGARMRPVPASRVPRWLRVILQRGLRLAPDERWSSLAAQLDAIQRGLGRARRFGIGVALGGAGAVAAIAMALAAGGGSDEHGPDLAAACAQQGRAVDDLWTAERRDAVVAAAGEIEAAHLDRHATALRDLRVQRCLAPPSAKTSGQLACLDQAVEGLRDTIEALIAGAGVAIVQPLARCDGEGDAPRYQKITSAEPVAVPSRSGEEIAFLDGDRVVVTDAAGKDLEAIALPAGMQALSWFPDGRRLVASRLVQLDPSDGPILVVTRSPPATTEIARGRGAVVSADGAHVAFLQGPDLVTIDLSTSATRRVPLPSLLGHDELAWSEDGDRVAACGMARERRAGIQVVDLATGAIREHRDLYVDSYGNVHCAWEGSETLLVSAAADLGGDSAIYALPIGRDGGRTGPLELRYGVAGRDVTIAGRTPRGALIVERTVTVRGAVVTPTSSRELAIRVGRIRLWGVDRERRRLLVSSEDRKIGWLGVDDSRWIDAGVLDEDGLIAADGDRVLRLTRDGSTWTLSADVETPGLPRTVEVPDAGRLVDLACGGTAPWRCVVLAETQDHLLVVDLASDRAPRQHTTELPRIVRNLDLDAAARVVAIGINESAVQLLDLERAAWTRRDVACFVQRVHWDLATPGGLVGSGRCGTDPDWTVSRVDAAGVRFDLGEEWPTDFELIGPEEAFVLHRQTTDDLGWVDGL